MSSQYLVVWMHIVKHLSFISQHVVLLEAVGANHPINSLLFPEVTVSFRQTH